MATVSAIRLNPDLSQAKSLLQKGNISKDQAISLMEQVQTVLSSVRAKQDDKAPTEKKEGTKDASKPQDGEKEYTEDEIK